MWWIIMGVIGIAFLYWLICMVRNMRADATELHLVHLRYQDLLAEGASPKDAIARMSEERHPELSEDTHRRIATEMPDVYAWQALMRQVIDHGKLRILDDVEVHRLLDCTQMVHKGGDLYIAKLDHARLRRSP